MSPNLTTRKRKLISWYQEKGNLLPRGNKWIYAECGRDMLS